MTWGVSELTVRFGGRTALEAVDLDIDEGMVSAVVGGDGAGKTTLARVLGRLARPDGGSVRLPEQRRVGYQPASSGSWPDLTVTENLRFVADAHGLSGADRSRRFEELLDATGLGAAADRVASHLSGGMRQKLGVAMALVSRPSLLVLDEPTTGVDPVSRSELWRLVSSAAADGAAVVMTTTYVDEAARSSRLLALEEGRVLASGRPGSLRRGLQGQIWEASKRPVEETRWLRGTSWRVWTRDGDPPSVGGRPLDDPDLTDLLTASSLAMEVDG